MIGWNHAAETTFGYRRTRPSAARWRTRSFRRPCVPRTGGARALPRDRAARGARQAARADRHAQERTEFPVELTITRISLPGLPTFTGYLRDITDRKRAEAELRASRARLVEMADNERRRIQRNLHDGAQQRLTAVLLSLGRLREAPAQRDDS